jgi:hypothetical protein
MILTDCTSEKGIWAHPMIRACCFKRLFFSAFSAVELPSHGRTRLSRSRGVCTRKKAGDAIANSLTPFFSLPMSDGRLPLRMGLVFADIQLTNGDDLALARRKLLDPSKVRSTHGVETCAVIGSLFGESFWIWRIRVVRLQTTMGRPDASELSKTA